MKTTEQRFLDNVSPANASGCWLWTACADGQGYGRLRVVGRRVLAHRFAWSLANGPIPDGLCVLHRCDVPGCMNPDHLFLGTRAVNNADRAAKGRDGDHRGSKNGQSKLTEARAVEVFHASGSQRAVGASFGISGVMVGLIKRRKYWTHATKELTS